jgi:hypothetical protein
MLPGGGKKGAPRTATASGRRRRRHFDSFANTVLAKNKCWIFQQTRGLKITTVIQLCHTLKNQVLLDFKQYVGVCTRFGRQHDS